LAREPALYGKTASLRQGNGTPDAVVCGAGLCYSASVNLPLTLPLTMGVPFESFIGTIPVRRNPGPAIFAARKQLPETFARSCKTGRRPAW